MEPIVVISLVASATSLTKVLTSGADALYGFMRASKVVDHTLESLYNETRSLTRTLSAIDVALSQPAVLRSKDVVEDHCALWENLKDAIDECGRTAERMIEALQGVRTRRAGFFGNQVKQYKLKLRDEDIARLRAQMGTHGQALSMCLSTINL